jgi:hypothetical protein
MADTVPAVTEESLIAERQRFWNGFTSATMGAVVAIAILLVLLAIFLV